MLTNPLLAVGFLAFFVVALVVGVRLLLLWGRTRELPELLIGLGVLGIGPVGFGLMVVAQESQSSRPDLYPGLMGAGSLAVAIGVGCKLVFNWRVYHAESRVLPLVVYAGIAFLAVVFVQDGLSGFRMYERMDAAFYARSLVQVLALLWGSGEALYYWSQMRRRLRIGLADPVVSNRFLLWGLGAGAAGFGSLVGTLAQLATGLQHSEIPWVLASSSAHGLAAAICMWLAFVPPASYTRYVASRAPADA